MSGATGPNPPGRVVGDRRPFPVRMSPRLVLLACIAGLLIAALASLVPVSASFGDDPLLRLRRIDPQLSTPRTTADCGSPVHNLRAEPDTTDLFDVARSNACELASRRRVWAGGAVAAILVVTGLMGMLASRRRRSN